MRRQFPWFAYFCAPVFAFASPSSEIAESETISSFSEAAAPELALQAISLVGTRYKYGGDAPETGLDCSGLVRYVFKAAQGMDLPRTSEQMSKLGRHIAPEELQPGDLVFYNTLKRAFSHVGIYLGDDKFIHAPSSGGQVRIDDMRRAYWKRRFNGARRLERTQ